MSEFDDAEMERLLGAAGGKFPDVNVAYEQLHGRVRHARRRRAVVVSSVACSLLFGTVLLAANRPGGSVPSQVADRDTLDISFPDDSTDSTDRSVSDTSVPTTDREGSAPNSTTGNSGGGGSDSPSSVPTTVAAAPVTKVFSGEGGSITVRLQDGALTLVTYSATGGFAVDVHDAGGDRVEVRFESASHRTRIRVDLKGGAMDPAIEESN